MTFPDGYTTVVPMRRTRHLLAILMAAAFLIIPSCSGKLFKQTGLTDSDLFSRGQQNLAKKSYSSAIEHFQILLERFPTSPLAPKSQLALADARMENGDNVEAEVAFDDFLRLYPASDNVPYALFRKGELLFRQGSKPGRDQTKILEAIRTYKLLLEKNPGLYAETAAKRMGDLRNRLAENEVMVVSHYLSRRKYDSAEARGRRAVADYSDTATLPSLMSL
ncbi:MAG TPA: outer membrane protein assembly factor BamD, partial [Candidatus Deferrimicrobiaceae bacterium]|nr:outer membrane protein assembly factor BamD [Candidatus Deferrimicrobiaceae bacterium]